MTLMDEIIEIAKELFKRQLVTGSTGNISYRINDIVYISNSGTSFRELNEKSFSRINLSTNQIEGIPSKEYPMHIALYKENSKYRCIIHTHSLYTTTISCLRNLECELEGLYRYTPYLKMKTGGKINVVNYHKPGSKDLFNEFQLKAEEQVNAYLLKNHGLVVAAQNVSEAFNLIEEFEQSSQILLKIKQFSEDDFNPIVE